MYTALYRAERPEVFDEILGQEHIVKILRHQIASDTVGHAYLFCGTRGTGKTTTARILAKGVNCLSPDALGRPCGRCANCTDISQGKFMDVIEIDAASNNGVDNIRELRESVKYPPTVGRKKVYIIDEVHMLSTGAFNALLKTLEEPPEDVMFILATTEPQKLPQTILSRCLKFDFKRVSPSLIMGGMKRICEEKDVDISDGALRLLANCADGSVRDGLSILDQVLASGSKEISRDDVLEYIGTAGEEFFAELTEAASLRDVATGLKLLDEALADGKDVRILMRDWVGYYRNLMIAKFVKNPEELLNMSAENIQRIKDQSDHISMDEINDGILKLSKAINEARWSTQPRILLELALVNIASGTSMQIAPKQETRPLPQRTSQPKYESQARKLARDIQPAAPPQPQTQPHQTQPPKEQQTAAANAHIGSAPLSAETALPRPTIDQSRQNDMLWHQVFEEGEDEAGSFNIIRAGTRLAHLGDRTFTVVAKTPFAKKFTEGQRTLIEKIMKDKLGRYTQMVCCLESELERERLVAAGASENASKDETIDNEELAQRASQILGIEVEID